MTLYRGTGLTKDELQTYTNKIGTNDKVALTGFISTSMKKDAAESSVWFNKDTGMVVGSCALAGHALGSRACMYWWMCVISHTMTTLQYIIERHKINMRPFQFLQAVKSTWIPVEMH